MLKALLCYRGRVFLSIIFLRLSTYERFHLEDFGQLSNHLGANHILFVPDLTYVVHGRTM